MACNKLIFTLMLLSSVGAHSATYYIDQAAGSDANNGTTTATPFKNCPGSEEFAKAGWTGFAPGDVVVFKRGVMYQDSGGGIGINVTNPGVKYTVQSDWGTGAAIFTNGPGINVTPMFWISTTNISICGLSTNYEMKFAGARMGGGITAATTPTTRDLTVAYCEFDGIGANYGMGETLGWGVRFGVDTTAHVNALVFSNWFHDCNDYGVKVSGMGTYGIEVFYNLFESNQVATANNAEVNLSSSLGQGVRGCKVHHNVFRKGKYYSTYVTGCIDANCTDNEIYNNLFMEHDHGIRADLNNNTTVTGPLLVHNNIFSNIYARGFSMTSASTRYAQIYNNIFWNCGTYCITMSEGSANSSYNRIFNNTFYGTGVPIWFNGTQNSNIVRNNLLFNTNESGSYLYNWRESTVLTTDPHDYNLFWKPNATNNMTYQNGTIRSRANFATFQTDVAPHEANSICADPVFIDAAGGDFGLQVTSPAIDQGTDLSAYGFNTDFYGTLRGQNWDIGAVEYHPSANPTLETSPGQLDVGAIQHRDASPTNYIIWNFDESTPLPYTNSVDVGWASLNPADGTWAGGYSTVTVSFASANLAPGTYNGIITITTVPTATNATQTIALTLNVTNAVVPAVQATGKTHFDGLLRIGP